ncbi:hypothetical protein [Neptunomonas antarctica]|uniref:Uncharacterized protein n=1 Tax=Neptunomonas antarctica TaxID=619304 RepID=A0A1N7L111_9GAMM|nr:hypothetical protein [Neptunomonas antarctica]SIS67436.1 hypothetical protein SAMN05421760_103129 [Neptunomonas antarctica]
MKKQFTLKKMVVLTAASLALTASPLMMSTGIAQAGFFVTDASAASEQSTGHKGQGEKGAKGSGDKGKAGQGSRQGKKSITDILSDDGEEDSDRPAWAGTPGKEGKPGGGNAGGSTKKGGDYGDIVVMLRNDDGTLYEEDGLTFAVSSTGEPIALVDGEVPVGADVQAVEFGRLNIARAPSSVLEHSLVEALSKLDDGVFGETVTLDPSGRLVIDGSTIDSPLENLALYEALLVTAAVDGVITLSASASKDGADTTYTFEVPESIRLDLAASALAAASDKTGALTIDEIAGISGFIGVADELATYVTDYTYDRTDMYGDVSVWVLVENEETGVYVPTYVNILESVTFTDVEDNSIKVNVDGGIDVFTQAADDAVQVLEFVHDNALDQ